MGYEKMNKKIFQVTYRVRENTEDGLQTVSECRMIKAANKQKAIKIMNDCYDVNERNIIEVI